MKEAVKRDQPGRLPLLQGIDLSDQVAIVTGGGAGIGRATGHVLARAGCKVVIAEVSRKIAETTANEVMRTGRQAVAIPTDVSVRSDVEHLVQQVIQRFGTIDILANIAGVYPASMVSETDPQEWDRVFAVNAKGPFNCCQLVIPSMVEKRYGRIVNVGSTDAIQPGIAPGRSGYGNSHYCSSKAALITFTRCLAAEMAPYNVNVNAISPGWVATENARSRDRFKEGLKHVPLKRGADPFEVAQLILFLVSEAAAFVTGENIVFSGGCVMD